MKHNIVASIAVFQSLYNSKQDIYSILAQFIVATINEKNLWTFDVTTLRNHLRDSFDIDVYESVLKTVLRNRLKDDVAFTNGEYNAKPSPAALEEFNSRLCEESKKYKFVFEKLIQYYRSTSSQIISDDVIANSFTEYILTDYTQDKDHIFSKFILNHSQDEYFISCLNEIKEGYIILSGIKDFTESTDLNSIGSWTRRLLVYLDTEELFSAYGYNGTLHQQILSDFLSLVKDANKRTKLIELKYLDETKKVVDGYFTQAIRIVEGKDKPIAQPAMNTILSRCHYRGDVLAEQGKFYLFLKQNSIEFDDRSDYVTDMKGNLQTDENFMSIKASLVGQSISMEDDEILKYLRIFSIINNKRHQENKVGFDNCKCILLTESSIPKFIAWHESIRESGDFTFSTTMDYAISRLWFKLHKGLVTNQRLVSLDVVNKVKMIVTSMLHQSVLKKYEELERSCSNQSENLEIYNQIRAYEIFPEEISNDNINEVIDFIEVKDVETLKREKASWQDRARRGDAAIEELNKYKQRQRMRYKNKTTVDMRIYISLIYCVWGILCLLLGYCVYRFVELIINTDETWMSKLSLGISVLTSLIPNAIIFLVPRVRRYQCFLIKRLRRTILQRNKVKELNR